MKWRRVLVAAAVVVTMAGCSQGGGSSASPSPVPIPSGAQGAVDASISALATKSQTNASGITVTSVTAKDWPDSSLGCPEAGMMYSQVVTPGYVVVLDTQGQTYTYHTDATGQQVVTCGG